MRTRISRRIQPTPASRLSGLLLRRTRGGRAVRTGRRVAALLLLLVAGLLALREPATTAGAQVLTMRRDLPAGTVLTGGDLAARRITDPPGGALTSTEQAVGRTLAAPTRQGEVVTDVRLTPRDGPDPGPGRSAVPIALADHTLAGLLRLGMHVAVLAVGEDGEVHSLCPDAVVLTLPADASSGPTSATVPASVVLAVPTDQADAVAVSTLTDRLTLRFT